MWIGAIIVWIVLSILAGIGARNKGRSFAGFFFLSLLLSPVVGLIAMAVVKPLEKEAKEEAEAPSFASAYVPCPKCGKPKTPDKECAYCGFRDS